MPRLPFILAALLCALALAPPEAGAQAAPKIPKIPIAREGSKPGGWTLDFEGAKKAAAESGLPILLLFAIEGNKNTTTLKQQILDQPEWKKFAAENTHLVWVDVPNTAGKSGVPAAFQDMHKKLRGLTPSGSTPKFNLLDSDAKTSLGHWNGIEPFQTPAYFCDLVKSHILMREKPPEDTAAKPRAQTKPQTPPAPAIPIKPARTGARPGEWTMDFDAAQKLAAQNQTPMLVFINGSDWNRLSQTVVKNIFTKPGWLTFARENKLPLVWADIPENKSLIPDNRVEQIRDLRKGYTTRGTFPAVVLLDSEGLIKLAGFDKTLPAMTLRELQDAIRPHLPK